MKKPVSNRVALERLVQRVRESGGNIPAVMQQLRQVLAGDMKEKDQREWADDFDAVLAEALRAESMSPMPAPAALPEEDPTETDDWKKFEAELEQELIRKFKL